LEVKVYKNSLIHFIKFENGGHTTESLHVIGECSENRTGTTVTFKPDDAIFDTDIYDYETLKVRIRELAFLNKGLSITLRDDRDDEDTTGDIMLDIGGLYIIYGDSGLATIKIKFDEVLL
jgi:DNA gyrase subunit B